MRENEARSTKGAQVSDEQREEQEEKVEDLEVSEEQAEEVKGGLGIRLRPEDKQGK